MWHESFLLMDSKNKRHVIENPIGEKEKEKRVRDQ